MGQARKYGCHTACRYLADEQYSCEELQYESVFFEVHKAGSCSMLKSRSGGKLVIVVLKRIFLNPKTVLGAWAQFLTNQTNTVFPRACLESVSPGLIPLSDGHGRVQRLREEGRYRLGGWLDKLYVQRWRVWFDTG